MRITRLLAMGSLLAAPAVAQDGRHEIAAGNNWSITDADCLIDASWDGDIGIVVNRHLDHHDLGIYDPAFAKVAPEKVIKVRYGAAGKPAGAGEYEALGHNDGTYKSYVIEAEDALLDAFAATNSLQFYRGKTLEIELNMSGFGDALAAMHACEAKLPPETTDDTMMVEDAQANPADDGSAQEAAATAAAAAMDAAKKQ